ncbi:MAG: flavodoxin domain-containing protein [Candidatus Helarchaeota archaeon]
MRNKTVLIAYATRYGTTAETVKFIAQLLNAQGIEIEILDLKQAKEKEWPSLDAFDGIIVASGIKIGRWLKEPQKFLKKFKTEIETHNKILGLFVSCTTCLTDPEKAKGEYIDKIVSDLGLKPAISQALGPILDFSETTRIGRVGRSVLKKVIEKDFETAGIQVDFEGYNDLRDKVQIRQFAEQFTALVMAKNS